MSWKKIFFSDKENDTLYRIKGELLGIFSPFKKGEECWMEIQHSKEPTSRWAIVSFFKEKEEDKTWEEWPFNREVSWYLIKMDWGVIAPILREHAPEFQEGLPEPSNSSSSRMFSAAEEMEFLCLRIFWTMAEGHGQSGVPMNRNLGGYQTVRYGALDNFGTGRPENIPPDWEGVYYRYSPGAPEYPASMGAIYAHPEDAEKAREIARKWGIIK